MSSNHYIVIIEGQLMLDPTYIPTDQGWVPSDRTFIDDSPTPDPTEVGFQMGMQIKLIDPLGSGYYHNKTFTVVNVQKDISDDIRINVAGGIAGEDTHQYEFEIIKPLVPLQNMRMLLP